MTRRSPLRAPRGGLRTFVAVLLAVALGGPQRALAAPPRGRPRSAAASPRAAAPPLRPGVPPAGAGPRVPELTGDEVGTLPHNTCRKQPRGAKFTITLPREAELPDLVNWMMSISCQKFIWDPKIRSGKVTILSPEPVTVAEAYGAFYAALEQMGLTVVPSGKYFKIVESTGVEGKNVPVYGPRGRAPDNDRYVTQLYRVSSGDAQSVADVVSALKSKQGSVRVVGDMLIITDTGASIRRLLKVVRQVDEAARPNEKVFFYQLQYADPEEVAKIIQEVFPEEAVTAGGATRTKKRSSKSSKKKRATVSISKAAVAGGQPSVRRVIVDTRTGTIVVVASPEDFAVIRRLIEQLDVPLAGGASDRIHVVRLRHADPEKVAQVLQQLATGAQSQKKGKKGKSAPTAAAATLFSGEIKVAADPATRSLVILASQTDFFSLKPVIEQLDAERLSVYIEVYLMELTIGRTLQAGAAGHFGAPINTDQGQGLGFVATAPGMNSIQPTPDLLSGIIGGVLGPQIPGSGQFFGGLGQDIPAFGVIIQALQSNNDVNVVAEPHLFTADNQEAVIEVGKNVPTPGNLAFPGGAGGQGGIVPVQGINRQPVKLTVKITPHINDDKTVTMDVEMEDQDIESVDQILGVTTTERRIELNQIVAHDDQPLVLGGLVRETERETTAQVPGLGSIPVIGWLFKRKRREKVRTNLLMILVPHIITSPDDVRRIHARRAAERMEFLERTSFKKKELSSHVNYRNKRGLLATIELEAQRLEEELNRLRQVELELSQQNITGAIDLSGGRGAEGKSTGEGGAGPAKPSSADPAAARPASEGGDPGR